MSMGPPVDPFLVYESCPFICLMAMIPPDAYIVWGVGVGVGVGVER